MGLLLEPPRRPAPRLAVFAHSAADSAGPRVWPLPGLRLPSGRFQPALFSALLQGLPYSLTLLLILLAHEFGHYLASAFHQVDSSLPYFLPSPILGTFGAF